MIDSEKYSNLIKINMPAEKLTACYRMMRQLNKDEKEKNLSQDPKLNDLGEMKKELRSDMLVALRTVININEVDVLLKAFESYQKGSERLDEQIQRV